MYLVYDSLFDKIRTLYFGKVVRDYVRKNSHFLDYGSGPGDMMLVARKAGAKVEGIDLFDRSIALAKKRRLTVKKGDYRTMSKYYKKQSFDVIFLQSVVEHMPLAISELLAIKPYLKKGGYLILSSPTPSTYFWDDPTHVRPFTPKSFKIMAEMLEMKEVYVSYVFAYLLGWKLTTRLIYIILNILPISLGSNLIGVYQNND